MTFSETPLLLAPAGSKDALIAAIAAGADAVYLGGKFFGARQYAKNFSDDEIVEAIRYAHLRGVEIFVTVNVLITEHELKPALMYLLFLYESGVDGVLIQDTGLLAMAREAMPDLKIHASTQMGIHNSPGAKFAASRGCKRIVLARELQADEIREIACSIAGMKCDIEIFLHGALCYGYSGRCLLSSLIGGRSGNRGMCAQPCRKIYQICSGYTDEYGRLKDGNLLHSGPGYLMSTKDLCLYNNLKSVCTLPVAALKIEGRMRSPEYVAVVVSVYRRALDRIREGKFIPDPHDYYDLAVAFSRGFTTGYLSGNAFFEVMGRNYPGNQGYYLGKVIRCRDGLLSIRTKGEISPSMGDGLVIYDNNGAHGFVIRRPPVFHGDIIDIHAEVSPLINSPVFITSNRDMDNRIKEILSLPDKKLEGLIQISCLIEILPDGRIRTHGIVTSRGKQNLFEGNSNVILQPAKTISLTKERIINQIRKTKETIYSFTNIDIRGENGWFAPPGILNTIRREIINAAETALVKPLLPSESSVKTSGDRIDKLLSHPVAVIHPEQYPSLGVIVSTMKEAGAALAAGANKVYIQWDHKIQKNPPENIAHNIGIMIPGIIRNHEIEPCIDFIRKMASSGLDNILVDSHGFADFVHKELPNMQISGYYGLNVTNSSSVRALSGLDFCTLSPELSGSEIHDICSASSCLNINLAVLVQGLLEATVSEDHLSTIVSENHEINEMNGRSMNNLSMAIRDEKGYVFPFFYDSSGRTHIMNSSEHCLFDEIQSLFDMGIKWFLIDARDRGYAYVSEMTGLWTRVIKGELLLRNERESEQTKNKILSMSYGGITRSGFRRGLSGKIKI